MFNFGRFMTTQQWGRSVLFNSILRAIPCFSHASNWVTSHNPATNTQATCTKAAQANYRHVITKIVAKLAAGAAATTAAAPLVVNVRDSTTGAGNVLFSFIMNIPASAGAVDTFVLDDIQIEGVAGQAVTLEFAAAGGANSYESVVMFGVTEKA